MRCGIKLKDNITTIQTIECFRILRTQDVGEDWSHWGRLRRLELDSSEPSGTDCRYKLITMISSFVFASEYLLDKMFVTVRTLIDLTINLMNCWLIRIIKNHN